MERHDEQTLADETPEDYDADERRYARILLERLEDPLPDWGWNRWVVTVMLEYHYCDNDARGIRWVARNTFTPSDEFDHAHFSGTQHTYRWDLLTPMCSPAEAGRLVDDVVAALPRSSMFSPDAPDYSVWVEPHDREEPMDEPDTLNTLPLGERRHTRAGEVFDFPRRGRPLASSEMLARLEKEGVAAFMTRWGPALEPLGWEPLTTGPGGVLIPGDGYPDWGRSIPAGYRTRVVEFNGSIDKTSAVWVYPFEEDAVIVNGDRALVGTWSESQPLKDELIARWRRETIEPKISALPMRVLIGDVEVPCWDPRNGGTFHSDRDGISSGSEWSELDVTLGHGCSRCAGKEFTISHISHRKRTGYTRWRDAAWTVAKCRACGNRYEVFKKADVDAIREHESSDAEATVAGEVDTEERGLRSRYQKAYGNSIFLLLEHWESLPDDELTDAQREAVEDARRARSAGVERKTGLQ